MTNKEYIEQKAVIKANIDNLSQIVSEVRERASQVWKTRYKTLYLVVKRYSSLTKPASAQFANIRTAYEYGFLTEKQFKKIQSEFATFRSDAFYSAIQRIAFILTKTIKSEENKLKNLETDLLITGENE